jgi:hypothetical protein
MAKKQLTTGNPEAKKPGKTRVEVPLSDALEDIAARVAGAIGESLSLSETLGDLTREAAPQLTADTVVPFVDACAQLCASAGLTSGSVKVYLSNMRGVLRAMVQGWKPDADVATLRAMYDAIPAEYRGTGANKGNRGPRQPGGGTDAAATAQAVTDPKQVDRETAIRRLFGHYDDKLAEAVEYAIANEAMFTRWAQASAKAAQQVPQLKAA